MKNNGAENILANLSEEDIKDMSEISQIKARITMYREKISDLEKEVGYLKESLFEIENKRKDRQEKTQQS